MKKKVNYSIYFGYTGSCGWFRINKKIPGDIFSFSNFSILLTLLVRSQVLKPQYRFSKFIQYKAHGYKKWVVFMPLNAISTLTLFEPMSATTLASENVPITYTEFHTSSCYCVKVTHASDVELESTYVMVCWKKERSWAFPIPIPISNRMPTFSLHNSN